MVPVGFMPMVGPRFSVQLLMCDGYAPVQSSAATPADMPMDVPMDMGAKSSGHHGGAPAHDDHGSCPYGSAPALGAPPALAILLPTLLLQQSVEPLLGAPQVAHAEVSPRAQSPRGPPA